MNKLDGLLEEKSACSTINFKHIFKENSYVAYIKETQV